MKQKKRTNVKSQQALVNQNKLDNKKVQTFIYPLGENVKEVCLAGNFNNWKPEPMIKFDSGFRATVKLMPGVYQYKFVVDEKWQADPSAKEKAQNDFGTENSVMLVN